MGTFKFDRAYPLPPDPQAPRAIIRHLLRLLAVTYGAAIVIGLLARWLWPPR